MINAIDSIHWGLSDSTAADHRDQDWWICFNILSVVGGECNELLVLLVFEVTAHDDDRSFAHDAMDYNDHDINIMFVLLR